MTRRHWPNWRAEVLRALDKGNLVIARDDAGISAFCGFEVNRAGFLARLLRTLERWLDTHEQEGFAPVRERWRELSSTLGQEVLVKAERRELRGVAEDIDTDGALLLRTEDALERVLAGDVEQVRSRVR